MKPRPLTATELACLRAEAADPARPRTALAEAFNIPRAWVSAARRDGWPQPALAPANPTTMTADELLAEYVRHRRAAVEAVLQHDDGAVKQHMAAANSALRWYAAVAKLRRVEARRVAFDAFTHATKEHTA